MSDGDKISEESIIIRNYRTSDYEATLEILQQLHDKYDIGLNEDRWKKSSGLRQFKPNLKRITLIAELKETGEVIGMGMIEAVKNTLGNYIGYLDNWAVKQKFIGLQVGNILAERAVQILRSWGCDSIRINIGYNAPEKLIDVFSGAGFKPILIVLEKKIENNEK
ncbi:MAG: GNAT family N-acetyltransferase [Candidatus Lokiarchaeota archaeon]|nr:GNAT family N-acetyltransferase [Candidatus Lokiarchaeota archaeon]MBD3200439.1 GNAT family N-acetyltransferase [Candidatus Lokiarchaeota archaeon]